MITTKKYRNIYKPTGIIMGMVLPILNKVGILGEVWTISRRSKTAHRLDRMFQDWKLAHYVGDLVIPKEVVYRLYEEAYVVYFKENSQDLEWLIRTAREVYDKNVSDIESDGDYSKQIASYTHIQDIAIRNAVKMLGKRFEGDQLVRVHSKGDGEKLSPGRVPFHRPEFIPHLEKEGWWNKGSIEDFYQKSRVVLVNPNTLGITIERLFEDKVQIKYKNLIYDIHRDNEWVWTRSGVEEGGSVLGKQDELIYSDACIILRKYFQNSAAIRGRITSLDELRKTLEKEFVTFDFHIAKLTENDPFDLKNERGYETPKERSNMYMGIISEWLTATIEQAMPRYGGCATDGRTVTGTRQFQNKSMIVDKADTNDDTYRAMIKGDIPPELYKKINVISEITRLLAEIEYKREEVLPREDEEMQRISYTAADKKVMLTFSLATSGVPFFLFKMISNTTTTTVSKKGCYEPNGFNAE